MNIDEALIERIIREVVSQVVAEKAAGGGQNRSASGNNQNSMQSVNLGQIEQLVKKGYNLQAQVLKVPHHGMQDILKDSKKARSDHRYLFKKVKAKTAIISNGYKNSYKAPHKKTLNELKSADVYDTGSRGTIVVTSDGKRLSVKVQKKKGPSYKKTRKGKK